MRVSLREVSKRANVSLTAASMALNGRKGHISEKTRKKVLQTAKELNYFPNASARILRGASTYTIGLIASPFGVPINDYLIHELTKHLADLGYHVLFGSTQSKIDMFTRYIKEFTGSGVDGLIICNLPSKAELPPINVPCVMARNEGKDSEVETDSLHGSYLLARHLMWHGHEKIGFITGGMSSSKDRISGINRAMQEKYLEWDCERYSVELIHNPRALEDIMKLLREESMTALMCSNDYIAGKLCAVLKKRGIRVPEDIAVTGFDGLSFSEFTDPPLTTVLQPMEKCAEKIISLLTARINGEETEKTPILIKPEIFIGRSCGCNSENLDCMYWEGTVPTLQWLAKPIMPYEGEFALNKYLCGKEL